MSVARLGGRVRPLATPAARLALALALAMAAAAGAARLALDQPRTARAEAGQTLTGGGAAIVLEPLDLTPEPGELIDYAEIRRFYARQDRIAAAIAAPDAALAGQGLQARRGPGDLPPDFWVQIVVGVGALLISAWVWALRPRDLGSSLFALSGVATLGFTASAAVYSTRALALPAALFQTLTLFNLIGASLFGIAVIGLFLVYPRRLKGWRILLGAEAAVFGLWTLLAAFRLLPSAQLGGNLITLVEMVFILAAIAAQHRATRREPEARAALTWLGLSVAIGAGGFIALVALPAVLGQAVPISQSYAFLFFLLIYLGLAAGLRRFRLFEVGEWGLRAGFYAIGAVMVLALDGLLVVSFGLDRAPAFSVSILLVSLLYLPFRDRLWRLVTRRRRIETHDALASAMEVSLAASPPERAERWRTLLQRVFDPLRIERLPAAGGAGVASDGAELVIPAVAGLEPLRLSHPHGGRALFGPADLKLAEQLVALVDRAEQGRQAYDRGVAEERRRVAQDLHDDVGARLISGLHTADEAFKPTLQAAIADIRTIVSGISGERAGLEATLAAMRYEAANRLEAAGIELDWPLIDLAEDVRLDYRQHKALASATRETVSNVVRHSGARRLTVETLLGAGEIVVRLADDGRGLPEAALNGESEGFGLKSLRRRMEDMGGRLELASSDGGTVVTLRLPLGPG